MLSEVIVIVFALFEILKMSQSFTNHQNEKYFGPG